MNNSRISGKSRLHAIKSESARLRIGLEFEKKYDLSTELLAQGEVTVSEALRLIHMQADEEYIIRSQVENRHTDRKVQLLILTKIKGIDMHLAEALIDEFGSLEVIAQATPEKLATVPGIDKKRAEEIVKERNGEESDEGTKRFFLIMPFSEEFKNLHQFIISTLQAVGLEPILWDEVIVHEGAPSISTSLHKAIELADIVIVDVTGNNPNVMFEAGFAIGAGKPILPLVQRTSGQVPSDISGRVYLVYDPSEPTQLGNNIKTWVLRYLESRREI